MFSNLLLLLGLVLSCSSWDTTNLNLIFIGSSPEVSSSSLEREGPFNGVWPAVELAVEHVNMHKEMLEGYTLTVSTRKMLQENSSVLLNGCSRMEALETFYWNIFKKPSAVNVAVVGAGCLVSSEAVAEISHYHHLPMVSYGPLFGTMDDDPERFPYLLQTVPTEDLIPVGLATIIKYYGWRKVVVITQDVPEFISMTNKLHHELDSAVDLNTIEFSNRLQDLNKTDFFPLEENIFVLNVYPSRARWIFCQALQKLDWRQHRYVWLTQGWYQDKWWKAGSDGFGGGTICSDDDLLEFLRQQRVLGVSHYPTPSDRTTPTTFGIKPVDFVSDYRQYLLKAGASFTWAGLLAYDAVWTVALGLNASISELSAKCMSQEDLHDASDNGVKLRDCIGPILVEKIRHIEFDGVSGRVRIDQGVRQANSALVYQYRKEQADVEVCPTSIGSVLRLPEKEGGGCIFMVDDASSVWLNRTPSDGVPQEVIRFPHTWLVASSYFINITMIAAAVFCLIFTITFRNRKIVKMTSPKLNYVILVGVLLLQISTFMFVYPAISVQKAFIVFCTVRVWSVAIGFSLCFGTINVKMWRIYYIFRSPALKKKVFMDRHLFMIVLLMVLIDVAILIPTTILNKTRLWPHSIPDLENPNNVIDKDGNVVTYVVTLCTSPQRLGVLAVLFGYKALIQAVGIVLATVIRNVQIAVLNDSREMRLTLYLSSAVLGLVVIITNVFGLYQNIYAAGYCYGIPMTCSAVLVVVFFSKMVRLYKDPQGLKIFNKTPIGLRSTASTPTSDNSDHPKLKSKMKSPNEQMSKDKIKLDDP